VIVLDSSFLNAFHNKRDVHHKAAQTTMPRLIRGDWGSALLPEYVFIEVTTVIALKRDLPTAIQVGSVLLNSKEVELVPCSLLFKEAWRSFQTQGSGPILSFVDSAIAVLAGRYGAEYLATFDRGFQKISGLTVIP
jgi:predicted nucleic acid-binding protein